MVQHRAAVVLECRIARLTAAGTKLMPGTAYWNIASSSRATLF